MWLRRSLAVMRKELREALRDRRSLMSALLYGVWGPAVMAMAVVALARDRAVDAPIEVPVIGLERAPGLAAFLRERRVTPTAASADVRDQVHAREIPVALIVDDRYTDEFAEARPAPVAVVYDSTWSESASTASRVMSLVDTYSQRVAEGRLIVRGVAPAAARPIRLLERDVATSEDRAARVLATLPIFLLVAAFVGGMGVAADVMAGERERRSLESLLAHPSSPSAIVAGKWAATALVAAATVTLTIVVAAAVLQHPRIQAVDLPIGISPRDAAAMWLLLMPLTLLVTAVQLLMALFARTYKEAQTQLSLLMFVPMIPGFLVAFGTLRLTPAMTRVPVIGHQGALADVLRGHAPTLADLAVLGVVSAAAALLILATTAPLLSRESIVRRA